MSFEDSNCGPLVTSISKGLKNTCYLRFIGATTPQLFKGSDLKETSFQSHDSALLFPHNSSLVLTSKQWTEIYSHYHLRHRCKVMLHNGNFPLYETQSTAMWNFLQMNGHGLIFLILSFSHLEFRHKNKMAESTCSAIYRNIE